MFILKATQDVVLTPVAYDKKGNLAATADPVWESSDTAVATVTAAADGTATVSAVGTPGTATITLLVDADLGDGVTNLTGTFDLEVVPGDAAVFTITPGTPTEQAGAPPADTPPTEPPAEPAPV